MALGRLFAGRNKDFYTDEFKERVANGERFITITGKYDKVHTVWFDHAAGVRTLKDMSEEEIQELERYYGCPVRRP